MHSRTMKFLNKFHNSFTLVFSRAITPLRGLALVLRNRKDRIKSKYSDQDQLESKIRDMAEVLVNMIVMGREKRNLCIYYDVASGLCKYIKIDMEIPTLKMVKEGDTHRVAVSIHPEVCAVCPFWVNKKLT